MTRMSGAQALAQSLLAHGVDTVFTVPGVQIMDALDALYDLQEEVRTLAVRHEQATVYMADGYARSSGRIAAALVVPGPGALNTAAAMGTAYACSSPVLLVSGQVRTSDLGSGRGALHEVDDQLEVFRPLTKWQYRALNPQEVALAVHEALRQLRTGRPRPVEVEIPPDVLAATGDVEVPGPEDHPPQAPDPAQVERAARALLSAERPLIWAGGGAVLSGAGAELVAVAEFLQAPIITTPEGKGAVPEDHPLCAGCHYYYLGPGEFLLPGADVVLAVGTRLLHPTMGLGEWGLHPPQRLVQVDIDPSEIGRNYPAEAGVVGDARLALSALLEALRAGGRPRPSRAEEVARARERVTEEVEKLAPEQVRIARALRQALPPNGVVVSGVTNVAYWCNLAFPVYRPRTYLTSSYFATLGFEVPTALGVKSALPTAPVVAVVGDGGFLYGAQELATAVKYGLGAVFLLFRDDAYGASRNDQAGRYRGRFIATDLLNPDFVRLAEAFGARGLRVGPEEVGGAVAEALKREGPTVIEVPVPTWTPPFQIPGHTH